MQETEVRSLSLEDSPGVGNDNPLQYSCLENSMNRGVHGVAKTQTQLNMHTHTNVTNENAHHWLYTEVCH